MWVQQTYLRIHYAEFSMVGGYTENLKNHKIVKIGGWELAQDNMVVTVY